MHCGNLAIQFSLYSDYCSQSLISDVFTLSTIPANLEKPLHYTTLHYTTLHYTTLRYLWSVLANGEVTCPECFLSASEQLMDIDCRRSHRWFGQISADAVVRAHEHIGVIKE